MREISPEKKAKALAALSAGKTVREAAKEAGVSVATAVRIRGAIPETLNRIESEQRQTFGGLLAEHFANQVAALNAYAKHTSTQEYIRTQNAGDIASLHGSVAGHTVRLLDIAARVGIQPPKPGE